MNLYGSTAGFNMGGFMGGLSDLINSDWAGVTLYGKGVGYDQQAVTNGFHPLIGMRRWGHRGPFKSEPPPGWKKMLIWTEAYETTNNLNWLAQVRMGCSNNNVEPIFDWCGRFSY